MEVNEQKIVDRFSTFCKLYDMFVKDYHNLCDYVYLNNDLLYSAIKAYYDDIERFKSYSGSKVADCYKRVAFSIKWISKFKPIQINCGVVSTANIDEDAIRRMPVYPESASSLHVLLANSLFAVYAGLSLFIQIIPDDIPVDFCNDLIYTTIYRDIDARQLAMSLSLLGSN
jgi:hypothetical protein